MIPVVAVIFSFACSGLANAKVNLSCINISSAPYAINESGCYRLSVDISVEDESTNAITIFADNVYLDLNGKQIRGPQTQLVSSAGIYAQGVQKLTVTNGSVTGFLYGIRVDRGLVASPAKQVVVSRIRAFKNSFRGISLNAERAKIIGNEVTQIGGSRIFHDSFAIGIEVDGSNCRVANNKITEIYPVGIGEGVAISLTDHATRCKVSNNTIENQNVQAAGMRTFGIWVGGRDRRAIVSDNIINGFTYAYAYASFLEFVPQQPLFKRNIATHIDCSPSDLPIYYGLLDQTNEIEDGVPGCSDSILARQLEVEKQRTARTIFRLAQAYYSAREYLDITCERVRSMEMSLPLFHESANMGLEEAVRILPGVKATVTAVKKRMLSLFGVRSDCAK